MRLISILLSVMMVLAVASPASSSIKGQKQYIIESINILREKKGLRPLKRAYKPTRAAQIRANSMLRRHYFAHVSPSGVSASSLLRKMRYSRYAGEAIAACCGCDKTMVTYDLLRALMLSRPHKNLMIHKKFNRIGVGIARSNGREYWSIVFARR